MSRRRGFTLIELLVVIAIIAILAAILLPVFARARDNARKSSCLNNLKQQGTAIMQYTQDYDEYMPHDEYSGGNRGTYSGAPLAGVRWPALIQPYLKTREVFQCPTAVRGGSAGTYANTELMGYWANGAVFRTANDNGPLKLSELQQTSTGPAVYCDWGMELRAQIIFRPWRNGTALASGTTFTTIAGRKWPHLGGINILYADWHVKWNIGDAGVVPQFTKDPTK